MKKTLSPSLLLEAYAAGIFPMGMPDGKINWYSPDPRGILLLDSFHTPHGLRRALNRAGWEIRIDTDFGGVLNACASRNETWITKIIAQSYLELFKLGCAHSVEVWVDDELAGGLYGVVLGGAFFGESMFHRVTDASKIALWHLVRTLKERDFSFIDTQWITPHLAQFGGIKIPREEYLCRLGDAINRKAIFPPPGKLL